MPKHFKHLNREQRYQIEARLQMGHAVQVIALALGVHRATIYRELARGKESAQPKTSAKGKAEEKTKGTAKEKDKSNATGAYVAKVAQRLACERRLASAANHPTKSATLWRHVSRHLKQEHSPDEIAGRLRLTEAVKGETVSGQAIYDWLRRTDSPLIDRLRHAHCGWRRRASGGMPKDRPRIANRPEEVAARTRLGDYEGDTIQGRSRKQCIVTLVDRKSLYTHISTVLPKKATIVARAINRMLRGTQAHTLTLDNGTEFAAYEAVQTALGLQVYFADPYHPEQRGRNEQQNKLIRQYIGKHANFDQLTRHQIRKAQDRLNHRPRKSLGYKTPHEVRFNITPTPVAIRT